MYYIGTSGYAYRHWAGGVFYPADLPHSEQLTYYAARFNSVELNNTFYRLPTAETVSNWRRRTPAGFVFAVKGSRFITHIKRLRDCRRPLSLFFSRLSFLSEKLKVVLWQLPPSFTADLKRLRNFCRLLKEESSATVAGHVFEFRHQSWFSSEILNFLSKSGFAVCSADSSKWPRTKAVTADFIYVRFHGHGPAYESKYSEADLRPWAEWLSKAGDRRDVYAYFNNDTAGYAVHNAMLLQSLIAKSSGDGRD